MENINERVLAYHMAKVIENDELAKIGGGGFWSSHQTIGPSGGSGQGYDVHIDVSFDW